MESFLACSQPKIVFYASDFLRFLTQLRDSSSSERHCIMLGPTWCKHATMCPTCRFVLEYYRVHQYKAVVFVSSFNMQGGVDTSFFKSTADPKATFELWFIHLMLNENGKYAK